MKHVRISALFLSVVWLIATAGFSRAGDTRSDWKTYRVKPGEVVDPGGPRNCKPGVYISEKSPYVVLQFCDDAMGDTIGIACLDEEPCFGGDDSKWDLVRRFWQEDRWSRDATSFAWSSDGTKLFVGRGGVYNEGGVVQLDLKNRDFKVLWSDGPVTDGVAKGGSSTIIRKIDSKAKKLEVGVEVNEATGETRKLSVDIP